MPSPCAVLPILSSYNYTSQQWCRYISFNYNNASSTDATQTCIPSYAQYPLQLKFFQSHSRCYNTSSSSKYLPFRDCQAVEELVQLMYDNMNNSTPRSISTFWSSVPQLLRKNRFEKVQNIEVMNHQLDDILGHTLQDINAFDYRDLSTVGISLAKIIKNVSGSDGKRLPRYGTPQRILYDLIIGENSSNKEFIFKVLAAPSMIILHKFDARHLSNLIYAYGLAECVIKFEDDGSTLFDVFAQAAIPNLHTFNGQDLSNMLWAYAKVKVQNSQLFEQAGNAIVATNNLNEFWPQALSNIIWSYATLDEQHPKIFERLGDHIVRLDTLDKFIPQDMSNTVWAFATADESHPKLYKKVADRIITLDDLHKFEPQHLSNTVWAYAKTNESHPRLYKKVANHIVKLPSLNEFKPQHLSNILWAFATAGMSYPQLFKKMADHIISLDLNKFKPQHLSNIMWAFANAGESHPQLFKKVGDHIVTMDRLDKFKPQHLSNTLWSFATAREQHPMLFKKVADHIVQLDSLQSFNEQELSNTVWAYATAEESHPQLFNKLADEAIKRQHELIPQQISNFLWAYATNGQVDEHLFSSLEPSAKANLDKCTPQGLANVAWAYSVANINAPSVFNNDFIDACLRKENGFELEALRQLHQWQLWQEELKLDVSLPLSLKKKCYEAFISRVPEPSRFQDDVVSILSSMGLQPQEEVLLKSGYRIDAVVEVNGKQVAVEVDGPSHFIGRSRTRTGSTILKHRQVATLDGIKVISIPYWEWDKLKNDTKKKKQYLRDLLEH